jgi:hypothetical protein
LHFLRNLSSQIVDMTQLLLTLEFFKTVISIPLVKWGIAALLFYFLIGHRFCSTTERSEPQKTTYQAKYGQLSSELLDSVIWNTVRSNPDMTAEMVLSFVNDTTLQMIDARIELERRYIRNFKLTRSGEIKPIQ